VVSTWSTDLSSLRHSSHCTEKALYEPWLRVHNHYIYLFFFKRPADKSRVNNRKNRRPQQIRTSLILGTVWRVAYNRPRRITPFYPENRPVTWREQRTAIIIIVILSNRRAKRVPVGPDTFRNQFRFSRRPHNNVCTNRARTSPSMVFTYPPSNLPCFAVCRNTPSSSSSSSAE